MAKQKIKVIPLCNQRYNKPSIIQSKPAKLLTYSGFMFMKARASKSWSSTASKLLKTLLANHFALISFQRCSTGLSCGLHGGRKASFKLWGVTSLPVVCQAALSATMRILSFGKRSDTCLMNSPIKSESALGTMRDSILPSSGEIAE